MPKRLLRVKRIYSLGQYQNVEFTDEISDISTEDFPAEAAFKVNFLQIIGMEKLINKYLALRGSIADQNLTPEQAIAYLDEIKVKTIDELRETLPENATHTINTKGV